MDDRPRDTNKIFSLYSKLLALYPKQYRREYGTQILLTAADMLHDANSKSEHRAIWGRLFRDLPVSIFREHYKAIGNVMNTEDESRFRHMSYVSTACMLVSLIIISASHIAEQVGYLHLNIGSTVLVIAIALPFVSAALSLTALQQIQDRPLQQLTTQQRHHKTVLSLVLTFSLLILLLVLASTVFIPEYS